MKHLISAAICLLVATPVAAEDDMRNLTNNILSNLTGAAPVQADTGDLQFLIEQAMQQGQSDDYLDALLSEAVDNGQVTVPDAMRTTTGAIDTKVLLASLVAKSGAMGLDSPTHLEVEASSSRTSLPLAKDEVYIVQPGDSLAAIAIAYYDRAQDYERIFEANRDRLSSPDRIKVGQELVIPQ